jgi:RNA polymerase sigma factor (sigma-70 family)
MTSWFSRIELLFQTHRCRLESVVRKSIRDKETSADIVQDVFASILAAGPRATVEDDRNVLYAAARNAAIEHHRKEARRATLLSRVLPEQIHASNTSAEDGLQAKQALSALDHALSTLSPKCREIFLSRRVEGLSNAEIARRFGISVNSVEKHIARALRHCQTCASDFFVDKR